MNFRIFSFIFSLVLTLSSSLFAAGYGVTLLFDDGSILLGKEPRGNGCRWSDFGGKQEKAPNGQLISGPQTAWRELQEETGHYTFPKITLADIQQAEANGHYADHHHAASGQSYRSYVLWIHGQKPSIQTIVKNARLAKQRLGRHAHVEKVEWKYFDAQALLNAPRVNGQLPGVKDPLFSPYNAVLRQPVAQQFLTYYINAVKALPKPQPNPVQKQAPAKAKAPKAKAIQPPAKARTPKAKAIQPPAKAKTPKAKAIQPPAKAKTPKAQAIQPPTKAKTPKAKAIQPPAKAKTPKAKAIQPPTKAKTPKAKAIQPPAKARAPKAKAIQPPAKARAPKAKAIQPPAKARAPKAKAIQPPAKARAAIKPSKSIKHQKKK